MEAALGLIPGSEPLLISTVMVKLFNLSETLYLKCTVGITIYISWGCRGIRKTVKTEDLAPFQVSLSACSSSNPLIVVCRMEGSGDSLGHAIPLKLVHVQILKLRARNIFRWREHGFHLSTAGTGTVHVCAPTCPGKLSSN